MDWFAAIVVALFTVGGEALVVDREMTHLRSGNEREWDDFPADADGARIERTFTSQPNDNPWSLRLRHRDVKQAWTLALNGTPLGKLPPDGADMVSYFEIAPGVLRGGANTLTLACASSRSSDDIMVGDIRLIDRPVKSAVEQLTLDLTVVDAASSAPLPCRLTIVDKNGSLMTLNAQPADAVAVRPGVVYARDGRATIRLPEGKYTIYAGRGFEYSIDSATIEAMPGQTLRKQLQIRREVDTSGYVACDTHIHTLTFSGHGDATIEERVLTLAGEEIELPIVTEHNRHVDYEPFARKGGARSYFTPVIGNEVTTKVGHFNVFPVPAEGPVEDFKGANWEETFAAIAKAPGINVTILNHGRDIHSGFRPFDPRRHLAVVGQNTEGWKLQANAMEVINSGATQSDPLELLGDWHGLMNRGIPLTPIGSSDSHDVSRYIVGQGRTYIRCDDSDPGKVDVARALESIRAGRVLVSYGLLTDMTVAGTHGPGDLAASSRRAEVTLRVFGPHWTSADRVLLYANGVAIKELSLKGSPRSNQPGVIWQDTWRIELPAHDVFLSAVALGPGIDEPYWPTARPYQPASPRWQSYVLGATGAVKLDIDGDGQFTCAFDHARQVTEKAGDDMDRLADLLAAYDEAVAAQAASIVRDRQPKLLHQLLTSKYLAAPARRGVLAYQESRQLHQRALAEPAAAP